MVAARAWLLVTTAACEQAQTPPMGWRSWNVFQLDVDDTGMLAQAKALATKSPSSDVSAPTLLSLGFVEVGVDDGWQDCGAGNNGTFHDKSGATLVNTTRFPDLSRMTASAAKLGVGMGWYQNNCWCSELGKSSPPEGHPTADLQLMLDAGFSGLKVDGCGPAHGMALWSAALKALNASDKLVVENCANNGRLEDVWSPDQGLPSEDNPLPVWRAAKPENVRGEKCDGFQMYRISRDIAPQFYSTMWNLQQMLPFLQETPLSRPGCWAYPDMLQIGNFLSFEEARSHFGAWCITSSPLVLSFDLTDSGIFDDAYSIVGNAMAIEVNQAWAGHPGRLLRQSSTNLTVEVAHTAGAALPNQSCRYPVGDVDLFGTPLCEVAPLPAWQIWTKPLPEGAAALFAVNIGDGPVQGLEVPLTDLGFAANATVVISHVWRQGDIASHRLAASESLKLDTLQRHDSTFLLLEPDRRSVSVFV